MLCHMWPFKKPYPTLENTFDCKQITLYNLIGYSLSGCTCAACPIRGTLNGSCKCVVYAFHISFTISNRCIIGCIQNTLWIYLISTFCAACLFLQDILHVWSLFVSCSQLQHRLLDKFEKENIILKSFNLAISWFILRNRETCVYLK